MIAGRRDETIKRSLNFGDRGRGSSTSMDRFHRRPKCPCCHLDIQADTLQENPDSCMVLKCGRCFNVFCGFCLMYSSDVAEVYHHATQWCRQNPSRPLARLPASISVREHFERLTISRMNEPSIYERVSPDAEELKRIGTGSVSA
ncbi:hypothetical protein CYMTET_15380 [Cymbomonas tetramitiformis]|uniref:IBR domain-containing protein n=1 Tax=Cymbomonas tetramitiformis TaxID=36881 RepID=A0AAE0GEC0_9CHLO|nr:hypothetical protein CYMTET_15380 [Cymbomonas tetramitiformis]